MDNTRMAKLLKALAHPKRLELFLKIAAECETSFEKGCDCFVADLIQSLHLGAPTISHHIKELENVGLITTERKGKFLTARVNQAVLDEVGQLFAGRQRP